MEWPKEAWFHYLGVRCTLELAKAVVGWSPGYFFACPHCGMALVVRHDATHHTLSIACVGHLQRKGDVAWAARFGVASPQAPLPGAPLVIQHGRSAEGGWKDLTTLITCYQQPDEDTLRSVVEFSRPAKQAGNRKRPGVRSQKLLTQ